MLKESYNEKNILFEWTTESCFQDHKEIIPELITQIQNSQSSIDLEMYIFSLDELGKNIIHKLVEASNRGVKVRLLVDGFGSPSFNFKFIKELFKKHNIEVRVYNPISSWFIKTGLLLLFMKWDKVKLYILNMNHRNHRKTVVFDRKLMMTGSANISQAHTHWRETMIEVSGTDVLYVVDKFDEVWDTASNFKAYPIIIKEKYKSNNLECYLKVSRVDLINHAKGSIKVVTPYFLPPYFLLLPLIRAAQRGVKVEFMVSKKCDVFFVSWFSKYYYRLLINQNISVYENKYKFLHTKVMIIDDQAIIGSSNCNYRSLKLDLELDILVKNPETLAKLNMYWKDDFDLSEPMLKPLLSKWRKVFKWLDILKINS